jgi:putative transposase
MARLLRIEYPGAVYHVTCRGNERKEIFRDDRDREAFIEILQRSQAIYEIRLFAYVLMDNHFHLLLETPLGNLSKFMRRFNIAYTGYFNRIHDRVGHLYQGRYLSTLVDKESYLSELSRYIHLNPVRTKEQNDNTPEGKWHYLLNYPWSSLKGYLNEKDKETFLDYSLILEDFGGETNFGRDRYAKRIREDLLSSLIIKDKVIGRALLGGDHFIKWVKGNFYPKEGDRECPGLKGIKRYRASEEIIELLSKETETSIEEVKKRGNPYRSVFMEFLYRAGGLTNKEIGQIFNIDYSTVSQYRRKLEVRIKNDRDLGELVEGIKKKISKPKN